MDESERLQRCRRERENADIDSDDIELSQRIFALLNNPDIDKYCMVDAYYYDFSVIPHEIQEKNGFWRDMYLLYGITNKGEMVTKWVERYDLDSNDPILNGKLQKKP